MEILNARGPGVTAPRKRERYMAEKVTRYCALFVRLRDGEGGMERIGLEVLV